MSGETKPSEPALDVLHEVWRANGTSSAELDAEIRPPKICKNMVNVTFDGMAGADGDLRTAWRERLAREGKLNSAQHGVRDLVIGPPGSDATR